MRKTWGYRQDQLSSTHPVYCEMPDLEAVDVRHPAGEGDHRDWDEIDRWATEIAAELKSLDSAP